MAVISSLFLVVAMTLAVVIGPQTRPWAWGPAMLALGISMVAALPEFWRKSRRPADFGLITFGALVAGWFAWRACISPVAELGQADLILLVGAVGTFISVRSIEGDKPAERILSWGIALLLLANIVVMGVQVADAAFTPLFLARTETFPSGFYAHYNEAANYLIASSLLVGATALFGSHRVAGRILLGLIAVGGLVAVYFTGSRGGILGAAVGCGVFTCGALAAGKRSGARWFAPALVGVPLVGLGIVMFLLHGWQNSQEARNAGVGIAQVLDSNYRLFFMGIAMSCIGLHPMAGGGSRSFSWESFRFYDIEVQGSAITHKAVMVHNELLQAATDYGVIGAGLLTVLLCSLAVIAVVRILFSQTSSEDGFGNAWRLGGMAALAGMFVQSCFSFVFHLFPGVLLLGICLGQMARPSSARVNAPAVIGSRILLTLGLIVCIFVLIPLGWKGSQVTRVLWPVFFSKVPTTSAETESDALTTAIGIWPQSGFYQMRAGIFQTTVTEGGEGAGEATEKAILDYIEAARLHPHDPEIAVNLANMLSWKERDQEAESTFERAILLQGGMEPAFQAHYFLADHLMRKGRRQFTSADPSKALMSLELAAQQIEQSVKECSWAAPNIVNARVTIHESLGAAREANGDYPRAMEAYDFASALLGGSRANYRAGLLLGKKGASAWTSRQSAEALGYFIEAKRRIGLASELPVGVTPSQRLEYLANLDKKIAFLTQTKVTPVFPGK